MRGVNKVILIGTCGADPEVKYLPSGTAVANVSLATTEVFKDKNGDKKEETQWHRLTFFGPMVENVIKPYVKKGSSIFVEGNIKYSKYEKDGKTSYSTSILCREISLLGAAKSGGDNSKSYDEKSSYSSEAVDDDIPF